MSPTDTTGANLARRQFWAKRVGEWLLPGERIDALSGDVTPAKRLDFILDGRTDVEFVEVVFVFLVQV